MEAARRRLRIARYAIGIAAASLFAVLGFVARASHPGRSHPGSASSTAAATSSDSASSDTASSDSSSFFEDDGSTSSSVGPAGSAAPSIQSAGS